MIFNRQNDIQNVNSRKEFTRVMERDFRLDDEKMEKLAAIRRECDSINEILSTFPATNEEFNNRINAVDNQLFGLKIQYSNKTDVFTDNFRKGTIASRIEWIKKAMNYSNNHVVNNYLKNFLKEYETQFELQIQADIKFADLTERIINVDTSLYKLLNPVNGNLNNKDYNSIMLKTNQELCIVKRDLVNKFIADNNKKLDSRIINKLANMSKEYGLTISSLPDCLEKLENRSYYDQSEVDRMKNRYSWEMLRMKYADAVCRGLGVKIDCEKELKVKKKSEIENYKNELEEQLKSVNEEATDAKSTIAYNHKYYIAEEIRKCNEFKEKEFDDIATFIEACENILQNKNANIREYDRIKNQLEYYKAAFYKAAIDYLDKNIGQYKDIEQKNNYTDKKINYINNLKDLYEEKKKKLKDELDKIDTLISKIEDAKSKNENINEIFDEYNKIRSIYNYKSLKQLLHDYPEADKSWRNIEEIVNRIDIIQESKRQLSGNEYIDKVILNLKEKETILALKERKELQERQELNGQQEQQEEMYSRILQDLEFQLEKQNNIREQKRLEAEEKVNRDLGVIHLFRQRSGLPEGAGYAEALVDIKHSKSQVGNVVDVKISQQDDWNHIHEIQAMQERKYQQNLEVHKEVHKIQQQRQVLQDLKDVENDDLKLALDSTIDEVMEQLKIIDVQRLALECMIGGIKNINIENINSNEQRFGYMYQDTMQKLNNSELLDRNRRRNLEKLLWDLTSNIEANRILKDVCEKELEIDDKLIKSAYDVLSNKEYVLNFLLEAITPKRNGQSIYLNVLKKILNPSQNHSSTLKMDGEGEKSRCMIPNNMLLFKKANGDYETNDSILGERKNSISSPTNNKKQHIKLS